jgi:hypothetical protein
MIADLKELGNACRAPWTLKKELAGWHRPRLVNLLTQSWSRPRARAAQSGGHGECT